jgi:hypothetical protein
VNNVLLSVVVFAREFELLTNQQSAHDVDEGRNSSRFSKRGGGIRQVCQGGRSGAGALTIIR